MVSRECDQRSRYVRIMPPRSFHLVATVHPSNTKSTAAVLQGFFFDSRHGMRRMLGGMVECAIWHRQWTNVLYNDRFKLLAFLLEWHARAPKSTKRFVGENLYALLFAAKYNLWLRPIQSTSAQDMEKYAPSLEHIVDEEERNISIFLTTTAERLLKLLQTDEKSLYDQLETHFKNYLAHEFQRLHATLE
jgi:hypothetical protein